MLLPPTNAPQRQHVAWSATCIGRQGGATGRHLFTKNEQKVRIFWDKVALAAIFLDLVKKGALDAER